VNFAAFLATWHRQLAPIADGDHRVPLFPRNSPGRLSQPAVRRRLAALDARAVSRDRVV
jgi:hypothetical protein